MANASQNTGNKDSPKSQSSTFLPEHPSQEQPTPDESSAIGCSTSAAKGSSLEGQRVTKKQRWSGAFAKARKLTAPFTSPKKPVTSPDDGSADPSTSKDRPPLEDADNIGESDRTNSSDPKVTPNWLSKLRNVADRFTRHRAADRSSPSSWTGAWRSRLGDMRDQLRNSFGRHRNIPVPQNLSSTDDSATSSDTAKRERWPLKGGMLTRHRDRTPTPSSPDVTTIGSSVLSEGANSADFDSGYPTDAGGVDGESGQPGRNRSSSF